MLVEIYIETENQIMKKQNHRYGYVISAMIGGKQAAAGGFGEVNETCKGTLTHALDEATGRLRGSCELKVYVRDEWVGKTLKNLQNWKKKQFRKADGGLMSHADKWKRIDERMEKLNIRKIEIVTERHKYSSAIQSGIKKRIMQNPARKIA